MKRRLLIAAACWPAPLLLAQEPSPAPRHRISAAQLHRALSERFPLRLGLSGLLEVKVSAPRLLLLPARNLIGAGLVVQLSGVPSRQLPAGEMDVVFALRWEAADRSLRAHRMELLDLRWPGLAPDIGPLVQSLLPRLARQTQLEVVLHRFSQQELALADTLGLEPGTLTVVEDGLLVELQPKARP